MRERQQVVSLAAMREPSLLRFYVSREWLNKFNTFAEPGPITNHTFLCSHGGAGTLLRQGRGGGVGREGGEPSPCPPCAFLRRHPAQQVPLHRRPGGDPAPERVGAPVQQVRCCGQPPLGGRLRAGEGLPPSTGAAGHTGAVAGPSPRLCPCRQRRRWWASGEPFQSQGAANWPNKSGHVGLHR